MFFDKSITLIMKLGLLLFIGLPGSGKTTLAKTLIQNKDFHFIHICYDNLITFKNQDGNEWKSSRIALAEKIKKLIIAIKTRNYDSCPEEFKKQFSYNEKTVIVLDDNMYFKSMRYSFFQMARRHNISFCQIYLNCSLENAIDKNKQREVKVPSEVIENMYIKIEPPGDSFWEKFSVKINAFCDINIFYKEFFPVLNDSLNHPVYLMEKERDVTSFCSTNVIHQTEIALRSIVGLKIKEFLSFNKDIKQYSIELKLRKSEILSDVKSGVISIPIEPLEEINQGREKLELIKFLSSYF